MEIRQAVILAGGRGARLAPLTNTIPKPMAPVNGVPFVSFLVKSLINQGITEIIFLVGYKSENIIGFFKAKSEYLKSLNVNISFSYLPPEAGTGDRLRAALPLLSHRFLLLYGDNYWPLPLMEMNSFFENSSRVITTTVFDNLKGTGEYGFKNNVSYDNSTGLVYSYDKTKADKNLNGVDIGYFILDKNALARVQWNSSFEQHMLPQFIKNSVLYAYVTSEQYYYITDLKCLAGFSQVAQELQFEALE